MNETLPWLLALLFLAMAGPLSAQSPENQARTEEPQTKQASPSEGRRAMVAGGHDHQALADAFPEQARWLEPEGHDRALALFMRQQTAAPKGAVLILADEGHRASDGVAGAMREPFARVGWATLSVGLPALPPALERARRHREETAIAAATRGKTEDGTNGDDSAVMIDVMDGGDGPDALQVYRERLHAQLLSALELLREEGYQRIALLAVGRGTGVITRLAREASLVRPQLVWVGPEFGPVPEPALVSQLQEAGSPAVLDIVSHRQRGGVADRRRVALAAAGLRVYSQQRLAMAQPPLSRDARQIVNRVSGWLAGN